MPKIHILPPEIVAKIAAGEVIERPAFAIKELIENAIDAEADDITIRIEKAGLKKIQVIDNGEGMDKEDVELSWQPHTTSKTTSKDTLIGIKSFGFRGEALASLAAVSTLSIKSRTKKSPTGNEIVIKEGKYISLEPTGMPEGTTVTAENLFAHIPARKKFLKSPQTEMRHIIDVVTHFAAVYPNIHFVLIHNNKILLDTPKTKEIMHRLELLTGKIFNQMLPVKRTDTYVKISGFVGKPQLHASTTNKQFLFVNKRKVSDKAIALAVKEAFGTMLEGTSYPVFILFLEIPYELVDVNVHPRKEQVSFIHSQEIFQLMKETIQEVLQENNITFQNLSWKRIGVGTTNSFAAHLLRENVLDNEELTIDTTAQIIQLHKLYIVTTTESGVIFVDQHAAHERILFEKLQKEFMKQAKNNNVKRLAKPIALHLSLQQQSLLTEHMNQFVNRGFTIQKNKVFQIPSLLQDRNIDEYIVTQLERLQETQLLSTTDITSEEMMAFLACRKAVKAGDTLTEKQMRKILTDLENTTNNATCPHGRPTKFVFPLRQINTLFKRT